MANVICGPLRDNMNQVVANVALTYARVYDIATGALVLEKTGLSTDNNGYYTVSDDALISGTQYLHDYLLSDGKRRMPVKAAE